MVDLTPILQAVVILAATLITTFLVPYIKGKTTADQQQQLRSWVRTGVSAAEQIYKGAGQGKQKKEYVLAFLKDKGYSLDTQTLSTLIESEVKYLWNPPEAEATELTVKELVSIIDPDVIEPPEVEGVSFLESNHS